MATGRRDGCGMLALRHRFEHLGTLPRCGALTGVRRMFTGRPKVSFLSGIGPVSEEWESFEGRMGANGGEVPRTRQNYAITVFADSVVCRQILARRSHYLE